MSVQQRNATPLLGMMIDRSSFDDDDKSVNDESTIDSLPAVKRRKNGRVRRKLRWKPPAFRSRNIKSKSSNDTSSQGDKSYRTSKSTHTFHSTETPIQSNSSNVHKTLSSARPNYPDTFEGMVTIDNEGGFVHARMLPTNTPQKRQSPPLINDVNHISTGSFDFHMITDEPSPLNSYKQDKPHIFDPFGQYLGLTNTMTRRPPKWTRKTTPPYKHTGTSTTGNKQLDASPSTVATVLTMTSETTDDDMDISALILHVDDIDLQHQIDFIPPPATSLQWNDVNDGLSPVKSWSPEQTPFYSTPFRDYDKSPRGKPTMVPLMPRSMVSPITSIRSASLPNPVLAKVKIDLTSSSSLTTIFGTSGLLTGQHYIPNMPMTSSPHKPYNRPVDMAMSKVSFKSMSPSSIGISNNRLLVSDDDSLSTKSNNKSMADMIITNEDAFPDDSLGQSLPKPRSRVKTGPVDVDEGAFVDAESHLNAIHEMAAEHLAHGEYAEALEVFEEILRGQRERYGEGHYRVGTALHNVGIVHLKSGDYALAVDVCKQAVRIRKGALAPNHSDVAVSLAQLGVAFLECRHHRDALIAFREAAEIRRECFGPKHPKVGKILNNIGCALYELAKLGGAKLAFEESLEIQRESLRNSPTMGNNEVESRAISHAILLSVASTLCNIGSIQLRWGHFEEASITLEEALLIQQSVLGDDHHLVLTTIKSIDFVDNAMENGGIPSTRAADFFSQWNPTIGILSRSASDDAHEIAMGCTSNDEDTATNKLLGMSFMQSFRWDKSKRWYQKVEELLPSQRGACGSSFKEAVDDSASTSSWSFRKSPTQHEI